MRKYILYLCFVPMLCLGAWYDGDPDNVATDNTALINALRTDYATTSNLVDTILADYTATSNSVGILRVDYTATSNLVDTLLSDYSATSNELYSITNSGINATTLNLQTAPYYLNIANMTNALTPIQIVVQDPTNGLGYAGCNLINDGATLTIDSVRAIAKHGSATGVVHIGIQDWNQTATNSAFVEAMAINSTGVEDTSLAGSTTLSNGQEIVIYFSDTSAFATTNQFNVTVFVRH